MYIHTCECLNSRKWLGWQKMSWAMFEILSHLPMYVCSYICMYFLHTFEIWIRMKNVSPRAAQHLSLPFSRIISFLIHPRSVFISSTSNTPPLAYLLSTFVATRAWTHTHKLRHHVSGKNNLNTCKGWLQNVPSRSYGIKKPSIYLFIHTQIWGCLWRHRYTTLAGL